MAGSILQTVLGVDDSGTNATTIAASITVTAGNHIIAHVGWSDSGAITATCSDGTSYTSGAARVRDATEAQSGQVFYLENASGGSHPVTATFSTTTGFRRIRLYEVSGLLTSSSLDQATGQAQVTPGTGTDAISSGASSTTTNANDFVMGFAQDASNASPGSGTVSAGTGYTAALASVTMTGESKSVTTTGAQTATFTQSVAAARITHVVAFMESVARSQLLLMGVG